MTIDKVEFVKLDKPITVYNFTVSDYHTYYVTDLGIWVHNTNCDILDWSIVSTRTGETRVQHVGTHLVEDTSKDLHGVFIDDPVSVLNQAWNNKASGTVTVSGNVDIWRIPYPEAGLQGGSNGYGTVLNSVEIIVQRSTNKIITGYPAD
ncbi:hypothetical protein D1872_253460 [compost metagenome]